MLCCEQAWQAALPAEALLSRLACPLCTGSALRLFHVKGSVRNAPFSPSGAPGRRPHQEPCAHPARGLRRLSHESAMPFSCRGAWSMALWALAPRPSCTAGLCPQRLESSPGSPRGSRLSVFPRLAEELETQSSGRCCAEHGQATSEGRLAGAEA